MFNIGGPSTGSSSFSSLVGIGSLQLEGLEAMIIFIIVSRDIVLKHLSVSLDPRSWQSCADSGQLSFEGICRFKESNLLSNNHDLFFNVHECITAEVKAIFTWGVLLFSYLFDSIKINLGLFLFSSIKLEK